MAGRFYIDTETNGYLDVLTKVHSLVIEDLDTGTVLSCADQPGYPTILHGLSVLEDADLIVAHNGIKFDFPAIRKVYPHWKTKARLEDTIVRAKVAIPKDTLRDNDFARARTGKFPAALIGKYKLEAFGARLALLNQGETKGEFAGPFDHWSEEMQRYCERDVRVGVGIWKALEKHYPTSQQAIDLEHRVAWIIARQERRGFYFNQDGARELYSTLVQRREEVQSELSKVFRPLYLRDGGANQAHKVPAKDRKASVPELPVPIEYVAGAPYTKVRATEFNPGSRTHIETWLRRMRGWEPEEFTNDGKAKVDDEVIRRLPWPEAKLLGEYLMINKRIGQLGTGKEALLKHVQADSCIRGGVDTNGAGTGRMTHMKPNMAQVPGLTDRKTGGVMPYGKEFRSLLMARPGYVLVGCDADALELRGLGGFMARYDGGAYIAVILKGNKAEGTDMHSVNMRALEIAKRDPAKTWFYAFIYGAGDEKLGLILIGVKGPEAVKRGKTSRVKFLKNLPAMGALIKDVKAAAQRGYLVGLDGRRVPVRSQHSALNTLIQGAGAILMKMALVILDNDLQAMGLKHSDQSNDPDYEFVANIHDEWQIEAKEQYAEAIGKAAKAAIVKAGEAFKFACPLDGNYSIGKTWADTH